MRTRREWVLKEAELPVNVTPGDSKLAEPEERARYARVFDQGLNVPTGFVLPVQRWNARTRQRSWISQRWPLRRGALFLKAGNSPVGFRLPLASLPYIPQSSYPFVVDQDPTEWRRALPSADEMAQKYRRGAYETDRQVLNQQLLGFTADVRTAVAVEPRDGRLHIFMPPVSYLEDYLELLAAIEASAADLDMPVHIEGYPPPLDWRLQVIRVAPDPGVIEVNVHPSDNWDELASISRQLYDMARRMPVGHGKIHDRRAPCRHRRRQPCRHRRRHAQQFAVPAPPRPAEKPGGVLAAPSRACPICSPACSSARPRRRRAWTRPGTTRSMNWRSRWPTRRAPARVMCRRGWWTGSTATC